MTDCETSAPAGIAIIGMAGRFPGAASVAQFWQNQLAGLEAISTFKVDELEVAVAPELAANASYVKARSILDGIDQFDAEFFAIYPREAALMDPQHRLFIECCWEAFESAGHDPATGITGVYAGCSIPTYLLHHLAREPGFLDRFTGEYQVGSFPELVGNGQDFLATKVSYKLNLRGPSISMLSACSTSLVAVVQACQALLTYQCDMALAGGASISVPQKRGTIHVEHGMSSADGHCRTFDADANGTVFGSGVGVVLLKRLEDAIADGDHITAVIRGFGINNDGAAKVGYTAPSIEGQAGAIHMAHGLADVSPSSIGYIEAHGTGTPLGDPIELSALNQVFRADTDKTGFCTIGTAKTNVGHLDVASGVTGLIHAAHVVRDGVFPPTLHYKAPNPKFNMAASPFRVVTQRTPWDNGAAPRRAGVSAFGVGGTNAHVVLEEAPQATARPSHKPAHLLTLSARTPAALDHMSANLATHLKSNPAANLADVAWTLATGRRRFTHARSVLARDVTQAIAGLTGADDTLVQTGTKNKGSPAVHFLFPGQGAQHIGMGRDLYASEPLFKETIDHCAQILGGTLGADLRELIYPAGATSQAAQANLKNTSVAQAAILSVEIALARLWMSWGIVPTSMIGHSVGEFAAAHIAGVFSLEDVMHLIAERGRLMQALPTGGMLSVRLDADAAAKRLTGTLAIAAANAPTVTVVAGPHDEIDKLAASLKSDGIQCRPLVTSHAFHSGMMDPVIEPFRVVVASVAMNPPLIPIRSCVTGEMLSDDEATSPDYWARHLREPVRYADAVGVLRDDGNAILLETGPGNTLGTLARMKPGAANSQVIASSLGGPDSAEPGYETMLQALASLWIAGVPPDWAAVHGSEAAERRRLALPSYPFERKRHWIDVNLSNPAPTISAILPTSSRAENEPPMTIMTPPPAAPANPAPIPSDGRNARIRAALVDLFEDLSGMQLGEVGSATFLETGFDSLFLTQVTRALQTRLGIKITFRQLLGDVATFDALTRYAAEKLPADQYADPAPALEAAQMPAPAAAIPAATATVTPVASLVPAPAMSPAPADASALERVLRDQMQTMTQVFAHQLDLMRGAPPQAAPNAASPMTAAPPVIAAPAATLAPSPAATPITIDVTAASTEPKAFGPYKPLQAKLPGGITQSQHDAIQSIIARTVKKASRSKELTQAHRRTLADPRVVSGFRETWKEMVFPITINRSKGSKLWDVDGNEYIDILNGFGPIMFGHRPEFIERAVDAQLREGIEIGPQTPLAGEIADLFCELTGNERMTFCNTGSEAVMAAMRAARAVTGRDKVVLFTGDYHGMFDEVLLKPGKTKAGEPIALPLAPGIPRASVSNMIVLDYGTDESLAWIKSNANDLAAVLVEPVQSRRPDFAPVAFLKELRAVTKASGTALVFDEVVTGFRTHPGGCQALFDIRADMATYGKVAGGGMPIGILAGSAEFMDVLDGGQWQYGDASIPEVGVTFFAGTFVRHPLTLAAVKAVMERIKAEGPSLQEKLGERTTGLVTRINAVLASHGMPTKLKNFYSFMFFKFAPDERFASLFYNLLRLNGIHILEGFPCFLTTEHSDADLDKIVNAFEASAREMREAGLISATEGYVPQKRAARMTLTEPQREVFLANMMGDDAACAFNESFSVSFDGALDVAALTAALEMLSQRHEALRLAVDADGEHATIAADVSLAPKLTNLADLDAAARDQTYAELLAADARTPFDLATGPLVRTNLVTFAPDRHVLVFTSHHIVCDGWSTNVILNDLAALYSARLQKREPALEPALSFAAYASDAAGAATGPEHAQTARYWQDRFKQIPAPLDLPLDRPREASRSFAGSTLRRAVEKETYLAIKALGARNGTSLFATLFAGYAALLAKLSGRSDIVIGVPMAGQQLIDGGALVGHCVNFLPLRLDVDMAKPFADLLKAAKDEILDAYDHQSYTYGTLVRALDIRRDPARLPLTEVQFNVEQIGAGADFTGLSTKVEPNPKAAINSDLFVNVVEGRDGLDIDCDYNTGLYDEATIAAWLDGFATLMADAVSHPARTVAQLAGPAAKAAPAVSDADLRQLAAWNQTAASYPTASITALFEAQVAETPDAVALAAEGAALTYAVLNARANRIAHHLHSLGLRHGDMVALCLPRSPDMVAAVLGITKAGCAYVPIEPTYPRERIEFMLADTRARALITVGAVGLTGFDTQMIRLDETDSPVWQHHDTNPPAVAGPDSLAYVMYTSGSTGRPKGVMVDHRAVVRLVRDTNYCPFGADQVFLMNAPLAFDASTFEIWGALLNGARLVVMRPGEPSMTDLARTIREHAVTSIFLTTGLFNVLIEQHAADLTSLRHLLTGGDMASPRHMQQALECLPACSLIHVYGPTEGTTFSTFAPLQRGAPLPELVPIGRPLANARLHVLDENQMPLPVGDIGELYIAGDGLARGYLNNAELTAQKFLDLPLGSSLERVYRTGDLVRFLADGSLEFHGRIDNQVKLRGFRIELGEIEVMLQRHADVHQACVVAERNEGRVSRLVAFCIANKGRAINPGVLSQYLGSKVPPFMVPAAIVGVDSYPLTANGKTDRAKLLSLELAKRAEHIYVAPQTDAERTLAGIVAEIMKVERVGVTDNLFEIGLDSLKIFQITSRAASAGLKVTPRAILQARTIRAAIESAPAAAAAALANPGVIKPVARQRVKLSAPANGDFKK